MICGFQVLAPHKYNIIIIKFLQVKVSYQASEHIANFCLTSIKKSMKVSSVIFLKVYTLIYYKKMMMKDLLNDHQNL